jgi:FAD dependent oxidoreductase TIGR03364
MQKMSKNDVAVVGAGIAGLAHAWAAAKRGYRVTVFDRHACTQMATVRNFGMVWPIGQPSGESYRIAMESQKLWLQLARDAGIWYLPCGSIHLAHRADEEQVLKEFCSGHESELRQVQWLDRQEVMHRSPAVNPEGLRGGMFSPTELCVNPRQVPARFVNFLTQNYPVEFCWRTTIRSIEGTRLVATDGRSWERSRILVCAGSDFQSLFPETYVNSGMKRCKLQMLKTESQTNGWRIGPHLASGLTLRHYQNFQSCPTLSALRNRIAEETPELDQYGIHVMASQNDAGEVVLGDSHEYDDAISPFGKMVIDDLMLRELRKILQLPNWRIAERWDGEYAKHPTQPCFTAQPQEYVTVFTGLGGAGMTMALGLAEDFWKKIN